MNKAVVEVDKSRAPTAQIRPGPKKKKKVEIEQVPQMEQHAQSAVAESQNQEMESKQKELSTLQASVVEFKRELAQSRNAYDALKMQYDMLNNEYRIFAGESNRRLLALEQTIEKITSLPSHMPSSSANYMQTTEISPCALKLVDFKPVAKKILDQKTIKLIDTWLSVSTNTLPIGSLKSMATIIKTPHLDRFDSFWHIAQKCGVSTDGLTRFTLKTRSGITRLYSSAASAGGSAPIVGITDHMDEEVIWCLLGQKRNTDILEAGTVCIGLSKQLHEMQLQATRGLTIVCVIIVKADAYDYPEMVRTQARRCCIYFYNPEWKVVR